VTQACLSTDRGQLLWVGVQLRVQARLLRGLLAQVVVEGELGGGRDDELPGLGHDVPRGRHLWLILEPKHNNNNLLVCRIKFLFYK